MNSAVERLENSVQRLVETIEALPSEALYRAPAPGDWPVMSTLAHVVELMPYWSRQALDVARRTQAGQPFGRTHDDPDRIGAIEQHGNDSLDRALQRIQSAKAEAVQLLHLIPADGWSKTARHATRGEMTVQEIVDRFLLSHVDEHLEQARAAIQAVGAAR